MKTAHTPAPWAILDLKEIKRIYISGGDIVCDVKGEHQAANARLIAASPELLACLKECAELMKHDGFGGEFDEGEAPALDRARAAIAKAEGN